MGCGFDFTAGSVEVWNDGSQRALRYVDYAEAAAKRGVHGTATKYLEQACEAQPTDPRVRRRVAIVLSGMGRAADALQHLRYAHRLTPKDKAIRSEYATALGGQITAAEETADWAEAVKLWDLYIADFGADARATGKRDAARASLEAEQARVAAKQDEDRRDELAAGVGAAAGATVGIGAGTVVGAGSIVGGIVIACLGVLLGVVGLIMCLTVVGIIVGIPVGLLGLAVVVVGIVVAFGGTYAGLSVALAGGVLGTLGGYWSRLIGRQGNATGSERGK